MAEITLTNDNFDETVLKSDIPVLVDFWATWCGPCKMIAPELAEFAKENEGKVKVGKVNVDEEERLAVKFGVSSIPTLILFKNGEAVNRTVGFMKKEQIAKFVGEG